LLYSAVLFVLASVLVGVVYVAVRENLEQQPASREVAVSRVFRDPLTGEVRRVDTVIVPDFRSFERLVNERTLDALRNYSFTALAGLFVASLAVGWFVAGRVLAPVDRITEVAREISATDLSRRIELAGPDDELKRLADTFDGMLGRLETAFSTQQRFLADASHELRNPLATIRANLEVAREQGSDGSEAAAAIERAIARMTRLIDDLLALARLEGTELHRVETDLGALVRELAQESGPRAAERSLALSVQADQAPCTGDPDGLKRALANLVDNALRHAPRGTTVWLVTGSVDGWAWAAVADAGQGIAPEHQGLIFERFGRVDEGRARAAGGTGLGLAIARQIVQAHGGVVQVWSRPGSGAVFALCLPGPGVGERAAIAGALRAALARAGGPAALVGAKD
jgi:signal transduction histidine kinase